MLIGLTGGIACGKSSALTEFAALGWRTYDADQLCADLYRDIDGPVVSAMRRRWGEDICHDSRLNRARVASIVFADKTELAWLNSLVHPLVFAKVEESGAMRNDDVVMFDVPLLFETKWERFFAAVIAVWSPPSLQMARLTSRGWPLDDITARLAAQISPEEKLERADYGIINTHEFAFMKTQCTTISEELKRKI